MSSYFENSNTELLVFFFNSSRYQKKKKIQALNQNQFQSQLTRMKEMLTRPKAIKQETVSPH